MQESRLCKTLKEPPPSSRPSSVIGKSPQKPRNEKKEKKTKQNQSRQQQSPVVAEGQVHAAGCTVQLEASPRQDEN